MELYTCAIGKGFGSLPAPLAHPCGRAAKALDDAGHAYDMERSRAILVRDDGAVIVGSTKIVEWASGHN